MYSTSLFYGVDALTWARLLHTATGSVTEPHLGLIAIIILNINKLLVANTVPLSPFRKLIV